MELEVLPGVDQVKFMSFLGACVFVAHKEKSLEPVMRQQLERFLRYDFSHQEFASSQPQPEGEDVMEAGVRVVLIAASETPPSSIDELWDKVAEEIKDSMDFESGGD